MKVKQINIFPRYETIEANCEGKLSLDDYHLLQTGVPVELDNQTTEYLLKHGFVEGVIEIPKRKKDGDN